MKTKMAKISVALTIFVVVPNASSQEPNKNDRFVKAVVQLISSFAVKRGLDEDPLCKNKNYKDFSVDEVVGSMPETSFKNPNEKEDMKKNIEKFKTAIEVIEPDGRPMWKKIYEQIIASYKTGGVIPNTKDGHCDVMYQAASNIFLNSKNNFRLMEK